MQSLLTVFRLGLGGLFLEPESYRAQRDAPNGLQRGLLLVLLVGLLVGVAGAIGDIFEALAQPSPVAIINTLDAGLRAMPWYGELSEADPGFPAQFDTIFAQIRQFGAGGGLLGGLSGILTTPLLAVVGWLIYGAFAHLVARALGGTAGIGQTLSCTALAAGVQLLALVQVIPFAQAASTGLLGLLACYVAIREAHSLSPWRSFGAAMLGPILLGLLLVGLACVIIFVGFSAIGAALGGAGR